MIDDTAGYHERHTQWRWSAGVGTARDGRALAWNLVDGVNDPPQRQRTDGLGRRRAPRGGPGRASPPICHGSGSCASTQEAIRARNENRLIVRSRYRQPFGTFAGELPGGLAVAEGYGVMEEHDAWW